jgi:hypothetical protein
MVVSVSEGDFLEFVGQSKGEERRTLSLRLVVDQNEKRAN